MKRKYKPLTPNEQRALGSLARTEEIKQIVNRAIAEESSHANHLRDYVFVFALAALIVLPLRLAP